MVEVDTGTGEVARPAAGTGWAAGDDVEVVTRHHQASVGSRAAARLRLGQERLHRPRPDMHTQVDVLTAAGSAGSTRTDPDRWLPVR